ncbi:MAG: hypothetical protein JNJ45_04010 [Chthonomonas sp.]|nr:hypothetical protein [Chthonomonas sp.]
MNHVVVLCAGDMVVGPQVVGALATYFGERPLTVSFWDEEPEREALIRSLAIAAFEGNGSTHQQFFGEIDVALAEAILVLRCAGEDFRPAPSSAVPQFDLTPLCLDDSWPRELTVDLSLVPHQLLRWIRQDDPIQQLLIDHDASPLHDLLDSLVS